MPIVTAEDVAAGVLAKWNSDTNDGGVAHCVPGGLHFQRVSDGGTIRMPYGVMAIEEGDQEDFSGPDFLKTFTVRIDCYGEQPAQTLVVRRALGTLFDRAQAMTISNATMLHVKPVGGKLELTTERRNANDVVLAAGAWEILVQGSRS